MSDLTHDQLSHALEYELETGVFTWRHRIDVSAHINSRLAGKQAGRILKAKGYRQIKLNGKLYRAARLAYFYVCKDWPLGEMDHINGNRQDDKWSNLRVVSRIENQWNYPKPITNTSGYKGVSWEKWGRWRATIRCGESRPRTVGYFYTAEEAHAARLRAELELHGEFRTDRVSNAQ